MCSSLWLLSYQHNHHSWWHLTTIITFPPLHHHPHCHGQVCFNVGARGNTRFMTHCYRSAVGHTSIRKEGIKTFFDNLKYHVSASSRWTLLTCRGLPPRTPEWPTLMAWIKKLPISQPSWKCSNRQLSELHIIKRIQTLGTVMLLRMLTKWPSLHQPAANLDVRDSVVIHSQPWITHHYTTRILTTPVTIPVTTLPRILQMSPPVLLVHRLLETVS